MISVFINSLTSGGAEKIVLTLVGQFRNSGLPLEMILIEKEKLYELPKGIPIRYLSDAESLENSLLKFPFLLIGAWRLKTITKGPQHIVQSHLLRASFINIIAKLFGSNHHAQIVVHSRINFDHQPFFFRKIAKWGYRQIFKRADSIVSICEVMKNELDEYLHLKSHPMHQVIYNPHNVKEIQEKANLPVDGFHFSEDKKYLISVGRLVTGKRVDDLILALQKLKDDVSEMELLIIGDGDLKRNLEDFAQELGMQERVHFLGYQKNPFAYIAKSDLLVLSSEWEGLPNILIEAMACGTPVISADCISGPREIINPSSDLRVVLKDKLELGEYGILYPVGNIDLLVKGIREILLNDKLRTTLEQKGLERATVFDEVKIAKKYLNTFGVASTTEKSIK